MSTFSKKTAEQMFAESFFPGRSARSAEYKAGVLYILQFKCEEIDKQPHPYPVGTVQADAWYAGCSEGHAIYRGAVIASA